LADFAECAATSRNAPAQPVGARSESPPVVIGEPQAPPTHLSPKDSILLDQVREISRSRPSS
jgi:hypothetical protein